MTKLNNLIKKVGIFLGLASIVLLTMDYFIFNKLQPKMILYERLSVTEEGSMMWVGISILVMLCYFFLSLFQLAKYLKSVEKITLLHLGLIGCGVLSFLLIFADLALLNDIGKQYKFGIAQPEWSMLYPIMGFQFIAVLIFTWFHLFGFKEQKLMKQISRDSNIFLVVQFVGVICGLMGLVSSSLGFLFPRAWSLQVHTTLSSIILLTPYALVALYWVITKLQEEHRQWYDEKQIQDISKSALLTLIICVVMMTVLFVSNYTNLTGIISILWFPLFLFSILFFFSLGNLYFIRKDY